MRQGLLTSALLLLLAGVAFAQPAITSLTPSSGPVGTSVVIAGTGFSATATSNIVFFGGVVANVTNASATSLTVTVPAGATYQPTSVTVAGLTGYSAKPFVVTYTPMTTGISSSTFSAKVDITTGTNPYAVAVGDIDGDGKLDVVNTNQQATGTVSVFRNAIQGSVTSSSLTGPTNFTVGANPAGIALGDLDGDGKLDMAATNYGSSTLSVFRNISTVPGTISSSTFSSKQDFVAGTNPLQIVISDLDLDGKPELIVTNTGASSVSVFRNTSSIGSISFATKVDFTTPSAPNIVLAFDIDQDGKNDLAVASTGGVSLFRNQSSPGTFNTSSLGTRVDFTTGSNPTGAGFSDIDGDGKPDLAVVNNVSGTISVLKNQSTSGSLSSSSLAAKVDFTANANSALITFADIDGDGKADMVTSNGSGASVYRNVATTGAITTSSFATKVDFAASTNPQGLAIGDLDGDGKSDILVLNTSTATISVIMNANLSLIPTITSLTPATGPIGSSVVIAGIGFSATATSNIVFFGGVVANVTNASTTSLTVTVPVGATNQPVSVTVGGLTGFSAKPFAVTYTPVTAGITASTFAAKVDITTGTGPYGVALGDIDGDGKLDMVNVNNSASTISVFRNAIQGIVTPPSFTGTNFTVGTSPIGVALGDIDGDGKLDMAVTNSGSATASVFRNINNTPGTISASTFSAKQDFVTGSSPQQIVLSDLDLDGRLDMVVTNTTSNTVSVFRNTSIFGSISFAAKVDFVTLAAPNGVSTVDIDQDGKNDLVVTGTGALSIFRNLSTPGTISSSSLATRVDFSTGSNTSSVAFADIDGDGKPDLAVGYSTLATISLFRNQSTSGTLSTSSLSAKVDIATAVPASSIVFADLDGDAKAEIVSVGVAGPSVYRNVATSGAITTSSFAARVDYATSTSPFGIALGDLDGDGKADIVVSNLSIGTMSVIMNNNVSQPPTITSLTPASGPVGTSVVIAGTGFSTTKTNNIVYFGGVAATVTQATATSLTVAVPAGATNQPTSVTVAGLTGYSPKPFIVTYTPATAGISSSTFAAKVDNPTISALWGLALGDIDGDGKLDLASTNNNGSLVVVFRNAIVGSVTTSSLTGPFNFTVGTNPVGIVLGDIDGDGKLDMAAANSGSATVSVFRNINPTPGTISASSFSTKQDFATGTSPQQVVLSDLDLDGKPEMIVTNSTSATVSVFRNTSSIGAISFATKVDFTTPAAPNGVSAVDIDQDGKIDLAVAANGGVSLFRNQSSPGAITSSSFGTRVDFSTGSNPTSVASADIDGDGKPDLAVASGNALTISLFRNTSTSGVLTTSSLATKVDLTSGATTNYIALADLDGDAKVEIITSSSLGASVYRNVATSGAITTSSFATRVDYAASTTPLGLGVGDLDGDGKTDLLISNVGSTTISFIMNNNLTLPPTITSLTPASGAVGTSVVIAGTGFSTTASNNAVYFGGVKASVSLASATSLTVAVPAGATYQPTSVTVSGLSAYSPKPFVVTYSALTTGISSSTFSAKVDNASGSLWAMALGDIDGDGKLDMASSTNGSSVSVFRNAITGSVTTTSLTGPTNFTVGSVSVGIVLGDMDGDGKLDMAATNNGSATVSVFRNISSAPGTISTSSFSAKQDFITGGSPQQVVLSDLDLDGKPEMIVANSASATVSVFRNTSTVGSISFAAKVDFTTLASPQSVAAVDIDQDGKIDLAVTGTGGVSAFRNQSSPGTITTSSFATKVDFTTGSNPSGVASSDVDGDGKPDLAVANGSAISLFRNVSTSGTLTSSSLATKVDLTSTATINFIAFADLDGDSKSEIVISSGLGASVYRNVATSGTITTSSFSTRVDYAASTTPWGLSLGDLDGDGKTDILIDNLGSATVSIIMNNNLVLPPTITSLTPASGAAGATVTIAGTNFNTVLAKNIVRFGSVKATVTSATATSLVVTVPASATFAPVSVTSNGLTGYSLKPFIVTFPSLGGISSSSFAAKVDFATNDTPRDVAIADIDDDGKSDLSVSCNVGLVSIYDNQATLGTINASSLASKVDFAVPALPYNIVARDLDGDGTLDLATSASGSVVSIFRNTTTAPGPIIAGTLAARVDLSSFTNTRGITAADFDGDGLPDLVAAALDNASVNVWRNVGKPGAISASSFPTSISLVTGSAPSSLAIGDLDGDGKLDIAVPNLNSATISLFRNTSTQGSISFTTKSDITLGGSIFPYDISIGDFDGDGKQDLVSVNYSMSTISVFRNVATSGTLTSASFSTKTDFNSGTNPSSIALGDLDGDGKLDMVTSNAGGASISVFNNTSTSGTISFATKVDFTTGTSPNRVAIGDLDGDSRPELVVQNSASNTLSVFRNLVPNISVTASTFPATFTKGTSVVVNVTLNAPVTSTVKFYAKGISDSDTNFTTQTVTPTGSKYEVTLGNTNFTDPIGLVYYFDFGSGITVGSYTYLAYATTATDQVIPNLSFGSSLSNYQIISLPLKLTNTASATVFKSLGSYDKKKWRLYSYSGTTYTENPTTIDLGKGYWLIVKSSTVINPGDGTTPQVSTASPATITLSSGWNLIGNPYNFRVSWADVLAANGNPTTVGKLRIFSGTGLTDGTFLEKYRGAFVNSTAAITLKIPVLKNTTLGGRQAEVSRTLNPIDQPDWELGISVTDGEVSNQMGAIGMHPAASVNLDSFDEESIPMPTGFGLFEIIFRQPKSAKTFEKDFVSPSSSYTWEFNVNRGDHEGPIALKWSNDYFGDNGKQLFLFDETMAAAVDMRTVTEYGLGPESGKMKVIYGDKDYVDKFLDVSLPLIGRAYPNPASETTGISVPFRVPDNGGMPMSINVAVYDSQGRMLTTLINGEYGKGYYEAKWQPSVSAGLYCIQTRVGLVNQVQKVFIK